MKFTQGVVTPVLLTFVSFVFSILFLGFFSSQIFSNPRIGELGLFEAWNVWDGPHYLDIADNWYVSFGEDSNWIVFLPLYPFLVRLLEAVTPFGILSSGYLVSYLCTSLAAVFLYKLVLFDEKAKTAFFSTAALLFFPTSFFLFLPYPESLFLMLVLGTFYFSRKGNFVLAAIFAAMATGTKIAGLALIPVVFTEVILHHIKFSNRVNFYKMLLVLNLPISGFLFYLFINYQTFGDIFYFQKAQNSNWGTNFSPIISGFSQARGFFADPDFETSMYLGYGQIAAFIVGILTTIYAYFKMRKSYFVFCAAILLIYGSMSYWLSFPRYMLSMFPLFMIMGKFSNNKLVALALTTASLSLLFVFGSVALEHGSVL